MAHRVIHSLRELLAPGCIPLFTSDGLNLYLYALTAHFGHWLLVHRRGRTVRQWQVAAGLIYGQVKKSYWRRRLARVTHVMRLGTADALKAALQQLGFSGRLNTAFIERVNLTVRHGVAALARRKWATAKPAPALLANLEWWRAYYHFVRPHRALRAALAQPRERGGNLLPQRYRQRTPAMAAGRTNRRWNEVGGRRVALRYVFNRPFPNRTGIFHCILRPTAKFGIRRQTLLFPEILSMDSRYFVSFVWQHAELHAPGKSGEYLVSRESRPHSLRLVGCSAP